MRKVLARKYQTNKRETYKATFVRFGKRSNYKYGDKKTILLENVVDNRGFLVADHLWMDCGKQFDKIGLRKGDKFRFDARVKIYVKGYEKDRFDYGLSYPSKIFKLSLPYVIKNVILEN